MIASEAVEAAAIAGYEARTGERWSGLDDAGREREEFAAQCALEAATPHLPRTVNNFHITNVSEAAK